MAWHAERTGGFDPSSTAYADNVREIYNVLTTDQYLFGDRWSYEAIVGLLCNVAQECRMNPWSYNGSRYGLVQFTFSYYQQNGSQYSHYAPSTGPQASGDGAQATDGIAQLQVIDNPSNTLYLASEVRKQKARDLNWSILEWTDLFSYKICDDIDEAIQAWLLFYEYPESTVEGLRREYNIRKGFQARIEEILGGGPTPPPPPPPEDDRMSLYFYILKRYKAKKGLL